jgi:hypothetical protein
MASQPPTLPSPPFFNIPNINNLRDAAVGLQTPQGKIRTGILFRSAEVGRLDREGWEEMRELGVGQVFDLRSKTEVAKGWSIGPERKNDGENVSGDAEDVTPGWLTAMQDAGVQRTWVPVFADKDYGPEKIALRYQKYMDKSTDGFASAYRDILKAGGTAYRTIALYLVSLAPNELEAGHALGGTAKGALIHCTAGKDRTGVFFGILFDFLNVPRDHIAAEYNLTEPGLAAAREQIVPRLLQSPGFQKYMLSLSKGGELSQDELARLVEDSDSADAKPVEFTPEVMEEGRQAALRMVGARKESMLATLEMVDSEFGGSERYLREYCGLGDGELEALRRVCVVSSTG